MIVKVHKNTNGQIILAICDKEILGKKFIQGDLQLDLTSDFYRGEEKTEEEILKIIKNAYILNIVGESSIKFALEHKLIDKERIIFVSGVPHAQLVIVRE